MTDLHCSNGPVSSMPGSTTTAPDGVMCDVHDKLPATHRVQGETDSFGCEYVMMCDKCWQGYQTGLAAERASPRTCDWCKGLKTGVRPHRDIDEGMAGPVYQVCPDCIAKEVEAAHADGYVDSDYTYRTTFGSEEDWDDEDRPENYAPMLRAVEDFPDHEGSECD